VETEEQTGKTMSSDPSRSEGIIKGKMSDLFWMML
jgi:hypothetical protein